MRNQKVNDYVCSINYMSKYVQIVAVVCVLMGFGSCKNATNALSTINKHQTKLYSLLTVKYAVQTKTSRRTKDFVKTVWLLKWKQLTLALLICTAIVDKT